MTIPLTENQILGMIITEPRGKDGLTKEEREFRQMVIDDAVETARTGAWSALPALHPAKPTDNP